MHRNADLPAIVAIDNAAIPGRAATADLDSEIRGLIITALRV